MRSSLAYGRRRRGRRLALNLPGSRGTEGPGGAGPFVVRHRHRRGGGGGGAGQGGRCGRGTGVEPVIGDDPTCAGSAPPARPEARDIDDGLKKLSGLRQGGAANPC